MALLVKADDFGVLLSAKPLNRIEMGAVGQQLDQMDTASCPGKEGSDIGPFVVGRFQPMKMLR